MPGISLTASPDPAWLETTWRAFEARVTVSFFQSWTWTGCLYAERFDRPVLLRYQQKGADVALGLFNQGRLSWHLGESGAAERDSVYIEHNGILHAPADATDLARMLRRVREFGRMPRRLVMSGIDAAHLRAAREVGGRVVIRQTHAAPVLDLAASGGEWLAGISANSRQRLRRSQRAYAALGALRVDRAEDVAQAHSFLDALAVMHQRTWESRGKPGAFARPFFRRFHRELIARGLPRDEIDLLRISAGDAVVGYLYNFRHRGRVLAYQSGFDYQAASGAQRPGLTCHHLAIDHYARSGALAYDFLAGDDRYKRSLSTSHVTLYWLTVYPSLTGVLRRVARLSA